MESTIRQGEGRVQDKEGVSLGGSFIDPVSLGGDDFTAVILNE